MKIKAEANDLLDDEMEGIDKSLINLFQII